MLEGTYGLIIQSIYEPNTIYCVRNGSPLLVGQNEDRVIVTSEQSAFCNMVNNYITLQNDDICTITISKNIEIENIPQNDIKNLITVSTKHTYKKNTPTNYLNIEFIELTPHPYNHWAIKEIFEQPDVILNSINKGGRIKNDREVKLGGLEQFTEILKTIENIILLGCGTSYFAGLYGMYFFKNICNFNTIQVFDGAELNIYDIPKIGKTAFIFISQSGETKDLHRCVELAKSNNIFTIGIINVVDSMIAREVDCGVYCNAGKEVSVASTKSFISQVVCLSMTALWFSQLHNINEQKRIKIIRDLHNLANDIKNTIDICLNSVQIMVNQFYDKDYKNLFLLGKGTDEYIAKEGALKIKEISYIHSEGYSTSSLKHGPFALLDDKFPVIIFNLDQLNSIKTMNCFQEVKARNAPLILITNNIIPDIEIHTDNIQFINVPYNSSYCSLIGVIPIQLFSYYLSVKKGIDPDKPKNLAKVVTVE